MPQLAVTNSSSLQSEDQISWIFLLRGRWECKFCFQTEERRGKPTRWLYRIWQWSFGEILFCLHILTRFSQFCPECLLLYFMSFIIGPKLLKMHYKNFVVQYLLIWFLVRGYQSCRGWWRNCRRFFPLLSSQKLVPSSHFLTVKTIRLSRNRLGLRTKTEN